MKTKTKNEKIYATHKGRTFEVVYYGPTKGGNKAKLVSGPVKFWTYPSELTFTTEKSEPETPVSDDDIKLLISALNREASVYRKVTNKAGVLTYDKKLAGKTLVQIKGLREKLEAILD
jgi:hypothetical protein